MDVRLIGFSENVDERGNLTAIEESRHVPFPIRRVFLVHDVKEGIRRGGHAHRDTDQIILSAHGTLNVHVSDGIEHATYALNDPGVGLYVGRMHWIDLLDFTPETSCLVLASNVYDSSQSIRTWPEYLDEVGRGSES